MEFLIPLFVAEGAQRYCARAGRWDQTPVQYSLFLEKRYIVGIEMFGTQVQ
jgi:hypothetical protein